MSNYGRRHGARIRRLYTGESLQTAMQGIARRGRLGLDECTPEQLNLRVLLALHLFNWGQASALHTTHNAVGTLTHYEMIISPRYDELVMITNAPENVTGYLAPDGNDIRMPGMRMLEVNSHEYRIIHLPTGARIRVTRDPGVPSRPALGASARVVDARRGTDRRRGGLHGRHAGTYANRCRHDRGPADQAQLYGS